MNKNLLYQFFEGKTTIKEEKQIRKWLEASDENMTVFKEERLLYDISTLSPRNISPKERKMFFYSRWIIAASIALLMVYTSLYWGNRNFSEEYNTLWVPAGQRINLTLSDGTNIWLNSNTSIRYPSRFHKKKRTIYLDGEAYFDVIADIKKPFIVKTKQGDIQVTGTSFNVNAYSRFNTFETSLFKGHVEIHKNGEMLLLLNPNEKSTLENGKLLITKITNTDEYLWRDGLIAFNEKKLEKIFFSLEKYFDVTIQFDSKALPQETYTGKFRQADGIDHALRVLQKSIHFTYKRDEATRTIYIQNVCKPSFK